MNQAESYVHFVQARHRYDTFDLIADLWRGETSAWLVLGAIAGVVAFFAIYKQVTGADFVKPKRERRETSERRKQVLWEYKRDR